MPTIVVRHKVGDINAWLKGHQERVALFAPVVTSFQTYQDADNPYSILLVIDTPNVEKLGAVINDPANAGVKAKHTVLEPITISLQVAL